MIIREISVGQLRERGTRSGVLLDVRSPEEFAEGHLPGAVNVPLDRLEAVAGQYAGRQVVAVCRSGHRSAVAAAVLSAAGAQAWSLAGGAQAWLAAGNPMEDGAQPQPAPATPGNEER